MASRKARKAPREERVIARRFRRLLRRSGRFFQTVGMVLRTVRRTDGKTWLNSNDWGDTGKAADTQTSRRLDNWIGLAVSPLTKDPGEGGTGLKFLQKRDEG